MGMVGQFGCVKAIPTIIYIYSYLVSISLLGSFSVSYFGKGGGKGIYFPSSPLVCWIISGKRQVGEEN